MVLGIALHPQFKSDSLNDTKFVVGVVLLLLVVGYIAWYFAVLISKLKRIDLVKDSVIESATRINEYKQKVVSRFKEAFVTMPVTLAGVILISWDGLAFNFSLYLIIMGIFLFGFLWGNRQLQVFKRKMDELVAEINELKEYKE